MKPLRQTWPLPAVTLDANGNGATTFTARGDVLIQHTNVLVLPVAPATSSKLIPTALIDVNGQFLEGSQSANLDASDTTHLMLAQEVLTCTWTGGDPGARATATLRGFQFPTGQGVEAVFNAIR
jgi:hypothetical protein